MTSASEQNKRSVIAFYEAEINSDLATWTAFWHKDAVLSFWLNEMKETVRGRDTLVALEARKFERFAQFPFTMDVAADPLADESKVLARLKLWPASLPGVALHYWLLFHFDEDGLIVELEEIADTTLPPGLMP